ncbi:MAG TPA: helix-turn-helix transcriptional regulator [Abditibacteriaceae bacterium]
MHDDLVILASSNTPGCRQLLDKHLDGYATIQFMARGGCEVAYDETWHSLEGAWFFPAHPGPRIRFQPHPDHATWHHRHIGFKGPLWNRWRAAGLWIEEPQPAPGGTDWEAILDDIIEHARRPGEWARLRAINAVENLLLQLAEARVAPRAEESWIKPILQQLQFNDGWPPAPDYAALARAATMSEATFRRKFKEATGTSPHAHFLANRVAEARRLLGETDLPLKEIAAQLGYANVYFFSRQFHEHAGISPAAFRRSRH